MVVALLVSLLLFFPAGHSLCASKDLDDVQVKQVAGPIIETILDGLAEGDFGVFTSKSSPEMLKTQRREDFLALQRNFQKKLGKIKKVSFLGYYVQQKSVITLFKATYSKNKDDLFIKMVLDGSGDNAKIVGFWFDSPLLEN